MNQIFGTTNFWVQTISQFKLNFGSKKGIDSKENLSQKKVNKTKVWSVQLGKQFGLEYAQEETELGVIMLESTDTLDDSRLRPRTRKWALGSKKKLDQNIVGAESFEPFW